MAKRYQLGEYMKARKWQEQHGGDLFETWAAWQWFRRKYGKELAASGELLPGRGTRGDLIGPGMGDLAVKLLLSEYNIKPDDDQGAAA
jgi:hypothetical protein